MRYAKGCVWYKTAAAWETFCRIPGMSRRFMDVMITVSVLNGFVKNGSTVRSFMKGILVATYMKTIAPL